MKFDDLYNRIFIAEAEEGETKNEIADPKDFDDVDPAPLPPSPTSDSTTELSDEPTAAPIAAGTASSLHDYINQLEDFAKKLNDTGGSSLQELIKTLDRPETPFEGSSRLKASIVNAAKVLRDISEDIKGFIVYSAK